MTIKVTTTEAYDMLKTILEAKLVPMVVSPPGCAKSALVHQLAKEYRFTLIDVRLSQVDALDLMGLPNIDKGAKTFGYVPPEMFPLKGVVDKPSKPVIVFLDEFNSASRQVQSAAYKLVLDRQIGKYTLHDNVYLVCAGNKATDNAIVNELGTAMQSRLIHIELSVDVTAWLTWAAKNNIDHRIMAYIQYAPQHLHKFDPNHDNHTFPSPRTWEFVSKVLAVKSKNKIIDENTLSLINGCIGEPIARNFIVYNRVYIKIPTWKQINKDPENTSVPSVSAELYALMSMLTEYTTKENIEHIMVYISRTPLEYQSIYMQGLKVRIPNVTTNPTVKKWILSNASTIV